jgi:hypothetical protein
MGHEEIVGQAAVGLHFIGVALFGGVQVSKIVAREVGVKFEVMVIVVQRNTLRHPYGVDSGA